MSARAKRFNAEIKQARDDIEREHLPALTAAYQRAIIKLAGTAVERFALTAAADWQPPVEGTLITDAIVAQISKSLGREIAPIRGAIILGAAKPALARIDIVWDVKHEVPKRLLAQAGARTADRLGAAVAFSVRDELAKAYDAGLSVPQTSERLREAIVDFAPWQADMLARTDLNSLANGASTAAADEAGMSYKTWFSTLDDKTRVEHALAHGQSVPLSDVFVVGGEEAEYPCDPNLSDAMACNCRCSVGYAESLTEAEGLLAAGGGNMTEMANTRQHAKRKARRATHATPLAALIEPEVKDALEQLATEEKSEPLVLNLDKLSVEEMRKIGALLDKASPTPRALTAAARPIGIDGTAAIEGKISDDNTLAPRVILSNALTWPEMPVSFLAQTKTAEGHVGAEVAGRIDDFKRRKMTGRQYAIDFGGELTNEFGISEIAPMIEDQTMRYVSVDLGATEWSLVDRKTLDVVPDAEFDLEKAQAGGYALGCTSGKTKALTLVATQAIEGAIVALTASADKCGMGIARLEGEELEALIASAGNIGEDEEIWRIVVPLERMNVGDQADAIMASATPKDPPRDWFTVPEPPGNMPLTILKSGQVYGHLATWDSCHTGFLPSCLPPPRSPSNYARFHVSELDDADGNSLMVGKLMFSPTDGGHADRRLSAAKAAQYYDRTGMAAAYLRAVDGRYGIWVCGSLNPRLTDEDKQEMRRELRLNPPSGDWRPFAEGHDLICGIAVAVPGFPVARASATITVTASAEGIEISEAIIASSGLIDPDPAALEALDLQGLLDEDMLAEREMELLAVRAEGMDALAARL